MTSTRRGGAPFSATSSFRFAPLSLTETIRLPTARGPSGSIETSCSDRIVFGQRATASNARQTSAGDAEVERVCVAVRGSIRENGRGLLLRQRNEFDLVAGDLAEMASLPFGLGLLDSVFA